MKITRLAAMAAAFALAGGAALADPAPAPKPEYVLIFGNANQISLMDRTAITTGPDGNPRAPLVSVRREAHTAGFDFAYAIFDTEFDCAGRRVAAVKIDLYDKQGRLVSSGPDESGALDWQVAPPHAQSAAALDLACASLPERPLIGVSMKGLPLQRIIDSIFDGPWPYDAVKAKAAAAKP